jgi:hypothetical protein
MQLNGHDVMCLMIVYEWGSYSSLGHIADNKQSGMLEVLCFWFLDGTRESVNRVIELVV